MANYQDLLDAVARIRAATGDDGAWMSGLSADDIAAVSSPVSAPAAITAILAKLRAAHADVFAPGAGFGPPPAPNDPEGTAAEAIRTAETALAQQNSVSAQVDLQVVTAVLNAHAGQAEGADALDSLQNEIEAAVATRTDLDTPAGARGFQRYLIDKLRDIRTVVETADLDSTSKASLAAALASLYASSAAASAEAVPPTDRPDPPVKTRPSPDPAIPVDLGLGLDPVPPPENTAYSPADYPPVSSPPTAAVPSSGAGWGGGGPVTGMPFGGGMPTLPASSLPDFSTDPTADARYRDPIHTTDADNTEPAPEKPVETDDPPGAEPTTDNSSAVVLPDGQTVIAPSPELAAVITAAVAGTSIPEAFSAQGITIPPPDSAIPAPIETAQLIPGDIGLFTDRHALALGSGKALLDRQIQLVDGMSTPGFIGWQHPPEPAQSTAEG